MHAPLDVPERQLACAELIAALNACHQKGLLRKFVGGCNDDKRALNACLRQERVERTTRNREESKERNRKKTEAWKEWDKQ
ncbi:hypothetical protein Q5752_002060 [Cryptotrichosporon argae]